jgi:hypothetical protein
MRRYVTPSVDAAVWCPSGRWGPKRVRVTRCLALLAEDAYTELLRDSAARARPGASGSVTWTVRNRAGRSASFAIDWELRPNAVWRHGRLFFRCPRCTRLATRLYVPCDDTGAACRRCWGLTYESRQERNYRPSRSRYGPLLSPRMYALCRADDARQARAAASKRRYAERREILARAKRRVTY